jgi:hypothetical protein
MAALFDDISRMMARPIPRRKVFGYLVGGLAAATLAAWGVTPAWAACPKGQFVCKGKLTTCCANGTNCCDGHCCSAPKYTCVNGQCVKSTIS